MRAIADEERLMPHLHLSMQAGDDMVLKRMKRRHQPRRRGESSARTCAHAARTPFSAPTLSPDFRPRPTRCSPTR